MNTLAGDDHLLQDLLEFTRLESIGPLAGEFAAFFDTDRVLFFSYAVARKNDLGLPDHLVDFALKMLARHQP